MQPTDAQVPEPHRRTGQTAPLQWAGGHRVQDLLSLTDYDQLSIRDRWNLIDRIDQKQDQYQNWLIKMPAIGMATEQVKVILIELKAKRLAIYLTIRPQYADKIRRANQPLCA